MLSSTPPQPIALNPFPSPAARLRNGFENMHVGPALNAAICWLRKDKWAAKTHHVGFYLNVKVCRVSFYGVRDRSFSKT